MQVFLLGLCLCVKDSFLSVEQHPMEIGYRQTFSICGLGMERFFFFFLMVYRTVWFPEALCHLCFVSGGLEELGE